MSGKRLLFVVTEDWYFLSHRLGLARAARDAGYDVAVACRVRDGADTIRCEGFALHPLSWRRDARSVVALTGAVRELTTLYRRLKPDLIHHIALMPMVLGGVAARLAGQRTVVGTLAGTGFLGAKAGFAAAAMARLLRFLSTGRGRAVIVQNNADASFLFAHGFSRESVALVPGSGVDLLRFTKLPEPGGDFTIGVASRFLRFKGIADIVEAQQILQRRGHDVRLLLAGAPDEDNPASHTKEETGVWAALPGVVWRGRVADVREIWAQAHVASLASCGGEGVPLSLLEAAACGRAIVTTDVPGCRDVVDDGRAGVCVPPGNPQALAEAFLALSRDPARRAQLAEAASARAAAKFSLSAIAQQTLGVYARLLGVSR